MERESIPVEQPSKIHKVWAYGTWWTLAEIGRVAGVSREAVRQSYNRGKRGEALFRGAFEQGDDGWSLGLSVRTWGRIIEYANRESPERAADVYGVPLGAVEAAISGDEWSLD